MNSTETIVISLGGSVVVPDTVDTGYIESFTALLKTYKNKRFCVVVGGGKTARVYIKAARLRGENEYMLDKIGIFATRLNASILLTYLRDLAYPKIPATVDEAAENLDNYSVVVMGGTEPGHTTDAVSVLLAERLNCKRVINATAVDGIYNIDPKKDKNAMLLKKIDYKEAVSLTVSESINAGPNVVLDLLSIKLAERSNIEIDVINGKNLDNFKNCIENRQFHGTVLGEHHLKK
ncbi:MAG: UMP kinase [Thermoplasmata archaeon]